MLHIYLTCVYCLWLNIIACIDEYEKDTNHINTIVASIKNPISLTCISSMYPDIISLPCLNLLVSIHQMQQVVDTYINKKMDSNAMYEFFPLSNSTKIRDNGRVNASNMSMYMKLFNYESLDMNASEPEKSDHHTFHSSFKIQGNNLQYFINIFYEKKANMFRTAYDNFIKNIDTLKCSKNK